ncbi:hypothetical protein D3C79_427810 [compost metagenome]
MVVVERLSALSIDQSVFALPPRSLDMTSQYMIPSRFSVVVKTSSFACGVLENDVTVPPLVVVVLAMSFSLECHPE